MTFRLRILLLSFFAALLATPSGARAQTSPASLISVDASAPVAAPETGYLHLGGSSSNGHTLQVNSRYLVLDGKPWLPVMGEFHYTRVPESQWEGEILKMKAGGINIVATYVFWIHHEEIEGEFDWKGRRDLRHFVELCARHDMYVWVRPGPWAHGEVRNGGFPDWLVKLPHTRSNDPVYLQHVTTFFQQIGQQLQGLMFKDGGPVVGAQLENEYGQHGAGRGNEHILKLKQIAIAAGIDPPLFSVTGWPSLDFPPHEVVPVSGGYPDGFWYGSQASLPPSMNYLFNFNRELGDMGATVASEDPTGKVNLKHDPYFAAEEAGGMASAYHRRPVLAADDIASLTLTGIGSGINLYGYYMFHGGTNPDGAASTLQESQATGFPNDLPQRNYDFQAPLGAFGQERESYRRTRLLHLFLNAYGSVLAPMPAYAPLHHTRDAADTATARVAVRTDGSSGFVFVNNYVRQLAMPARPGFQVKVKLAGGEVAIPASPVDIPADSYFAWPFHLPLGSALLQYSTAQLLTRIVTQTGDVVVFFAIPGVAPEFEFDTEGVRELSAPAAHVTRSPRAVRVTDLTPGLNAAIHLTDREGRVTTLLVLSRELAEQVTLLHADGADHLALSSSSMLFDGVRLRLRSYSAAQQVSLLPDLALARGSAMESATHDGRWSCYRFTAPSQKVALEVEKLQAAKPRQAMAMGPYVDWRKEAVPTVPPEAEFAQAARWRLTWKHAPLPGVSQVLLRVRYTGDIARLSSAGNLLDDDFYNGLPWEVGFDPATPAATAILDLQILPMPATAPIYLDPAARRLEETSGVGPALLGVELVPEYEVVLQTGHAQQSSQAGPQRPSGRSH